MADRFGLPLTICAASASPHKSSLVAATLDSHFVAEVPERLIGDRAYDADPLDEAILELGIEMIAPHRRSRKVRNAPRPRMATPCGATSGAGRSSGS